MVIIVEHCLVPGNLEFNLDEHKVLTFLNELLTVLHSSVNILMYFSDFQAVPKKIIYKGVSEECNV